MEQLEENMSQEKIQLEIDELKGKATWAVYVSISFFTVSIISIFSFVTVEDVTFFLIIGLICFPLGIFAFIKYRRYKKHYEKLKAKL